MIRESRYGGTMRLGAYGARLKPDSIVFNLYKHANRIKKDAPKVRKFRKSETDGFRLGALRDYKNIVLERHRHRYEVCPDYIKTLERQGLRFSGYHITEDGTKLMEFLEIPSHPFFVATQAHPEFKSSLEHPAPLFHGFIRAALERKTTLQGE
jgi:CTP synthase